MLFTPRRATTFAEITLDKLLRREDEDLLPWGLSSIETRNINCAREKIPADAIMLLEQQDNLRKGIKALAKVVAGAHDQLNALKTTDYSEGALYYLFYKDLSEKTNDEVLKDFYRKEARARARNTKGLKAEIAKAEPDLKLIKEQAETITSTFQQFNAIKGEWNTWSADTNFGHNAIEGGMDTVAGRAANFGQFFDAIMGKGVHRTGLEIIGSSTAALNYLFFKEIADNTGADEKRVKDFYSKRAENNLIYDGIERLFNGTFRTESRQENDWIQKIGQALEKQAEHSPSDAISTLHELFSSMSIDIDNTDERMNLPTTLRNIAEFYPKLVQIGLDNGTLRDKEKTANKIIEQLDFEYMLKQMYEGRVMGYSGRDFRDIRDKVKELVYPTPVDEEDQVKAHEKEPVHPKETKKRWGSDAYHKITSLVFKR